MRAPSFWWRKPGIASAWLAPAAAAYGAVAARRMQQRGRAVGLPVVCVGDLTLGGAGKTPLALLLGRILTAAGKRPFFLTRGYGGARPGPLAVDIAGHYAAQVGDEPLLLARVAPTIVARDRVAGAAAARLRGASSVIMDDGFQNPTLVKHLAILAVDAERGIGNGAVFPAGPLRAPLAIQLARAHALVLVGDGSSGSALAAGFHAGPVFRGRLMPDSAALAALAGQSVLAFAGIGHPEKFFATLEAAGIAAPVRRRFPDHHRYTAREAAALVAEAERSGLVPVTTEKDLVRLAGDHAAASLARCARALPVTLALEDEDAFREFVLGALDKARIGAPG